MQRVAQQGFLGEIRLYEHEPDGNGTWSLADTLSAPLPFEPSSGLGNGVDIDGDKVLSLKSFFDDSSNSFTRLLHKFPDEEVRRAVFPGRGAEIFHPEHSSHYVRIEKSSTRLGNAAIPGSVALRRRKFMQ